MDYLSISLKNDTKHLLIMLFSKISAAKKKKENYRGMSSSYLIKSLSSFLGFNIFLLSLLSFL